MFILEKGINSQAIYMLNIYHYIIAENIIFIDTLFSITLHVLILYVQRLSNALRIISPDRSKKSQEIGSYGSTWSQSRIALSLFRAGGFYKVFSQCCRFLDRQVWWGEK